MDDDHDNVTAITDRQMNEGQSVRELEIARAKTLLDDAGELHHAVSDGVDGADLDRIARRIIHLGKHFADDDSAKPPPGVLACARRAVQSYADRPASTGAGGGENLGDAMCALDEAIDTHDARRR